MYQKKAWAFRGVCAAATLSTALFIGSPYLEEQCSWYDSIADTRESQVQAAALAIGTTITALAAASLVEESKMAAVPASGCDSLDK